MKPVFSGDFSDEQSVFAAFQLSDLDTAEVELLYAGYDCYRYEGQAFVLFRERGKLYEVNASHCSCYGLEDGWRPEETTLKDMRFRLENGRAMFTKEFLDILEKESPMSNVEVKVETNDIEALVDAAVKKALKGSAVSDVIGAKVTDLVSGDTFGERIEDLVNDAFDSEEIRNLLKARIVEELKGNIEDLVVDLMSNIRIAID